VKRKKKPYSKRNTRKTSWPFVDETKIAKSVKVRICQIAGSAGKGDKLAALELYEIASLGTGLLNRLALMRPDFFSPIAASKVSWPVLWGTHPEKIEDNKALIERLKLGSGLGINFSQVGKIFSLNVPANLVAIHLVRLAQALRRAPIRDWDGYETILLFFILQFKEGGAARDAQQFRELEAWGRRIDKILPRFSRGTVRQWKSPMRELFRIVYGDKFDQSPYLQKLRKSVIGHAKDIFGKQGPGVVRQAMLRKVLQALNSIAPLD